jgi:hypothetical protein
MTRAPRAGSPASTAHHRHRTCRAGAPAEQEPPQQQQQQQQQERLKELPPQQQHASRTRLLCFDGKGIAISFL